MSYAKLFGTITDSSLWSASKDARILFVSMLARADSTGFVEAALPGLARLANLTLQETEAALFDLMAPDPHSKSPDHEGRRVVIVPRGWCLVNYEAYRERRNDEERREYMREYMQKYRKQPVSKKVNMLTKSKPCKPPLANTETETETETEKRNIDGAKAPKKEAKPDSQFDLFWNGYDKKTGKVDTLKAWGKLSEDDKFKAVASATAYAKLHDDPKFRKDPVRFIKGRHWEDEDVAQTTVAPARWATNYREGMTQAEIDAGNARIDALEALQ